MEIVLIKAFSQKPCRSHGTYQLIESSLKEQWRVHSINTKDPMSLFGFIKRLQWEKRKKLFVFNIAEFLDEDNRSGFLPSFLDDMNIPYLGSSEKSAEIRFDKSETKRLLIENGIPTPRYFVLGNQKTEKSFDVSKICFPLIVKPIREGGYFGVRNDSIVHDDVGLNKIAHRIFEGCNQPVLVEEFITGSSTREFSVGIIDGEARLYAPIELLPVSISYFTATSGYQSTDQNFAQLNLVQSGKLHEDILRLAASTFDIVGANDYGRVNIMMKGSELFVLGINTMPGLGPNSFITQAVKKAHGLGYNKLIQNLVENSILRQKYPGLKN